MSERSERTPPGLFPLPPSKNIAQRALAIAALAQGTSRVLRPGQATDVQVLIDGLVALGVTVSRKGQDLEIEGRGGRFDPPQGARIDGRDAGAATRFLLALAERACRPVAFALGPRLTQRPMQPLREALGALRRGRVEVDGQHSSQFISALLLIGPVLERPLEVSCAGPPVSAPYIDMTLRVMRDFGAEVEALGPWHWRTRPGGYAARDYSVPPDASSATYPLAGAAIAGVEVLLEDWPVIEIQPDAALVAPLERMGASVLREGRTLRLRGTAILRGLEWDARGAPDAVCALAVACACAKGPSRITGIAHLRHKESDRLAALAEILRALGGEARVLPDGLEIHPRPLHGGRVTVRGDHRLAMASAALALRVPGIEIDDPGCVRKSFPGFWDAWRAWLDDCSPPSGCL